MKTINEEIDLSDKLEIITMMDLRKNPGEIIAQVALGKTFIITKAGKQMGVLQKLPGDSLTVTVNSKGKLGYSL